MDERSSEVIPLSLLFATDPDTPELSSIVFTVTTEPQEGSLLVSGNPLSSTGNTFTLQNIVDAEVVYEHAGGPPSNDEFEFTVSDGISTATSPKTFLIEIQDVNDPPVITSFEDVSTTYTQPVKIAPSLQITDDGNELNFGYVAAAVSSATFLDKTALGTASPGFYVLTSVFS